MSHPFLRIYINQMCINSKYPLILDFEYHKKTQINLAWFWTSTHSPILWTGVICYRQPELRQISLHQRHNLYGKITNGHAENIKLLNKVSYKRGGGTFQESILLQSYGFNLALVDKLVIKVSFKSQNWHHLSLAMNMLFSSGIGGQNLESFSS